MVGIKSGQTRRPCRTCECSLVEMQSAFDRFGRGDAMRSTDNVVAAQSRNDKEYLFSRSVHQGLEVCDNNPAFVDA